MSVAKQSLLKTAAMITSAITAKMTTKRKRNGSDSAGGGNGAASSIAAAAKWFEGRVVAKTGRSNGAGRGETTPVEAAVEEADIVVEERLLASTAADIAAAMDRQTAREERLNSFDTGATSTKPSLDSTSTKHSLDSTERRRKKKKKKLKKKKKPKDRPKEQNRNRSATKGTDDIPIDDDSTTSFTTASTTRSKESHRVSKKKRKRANLLNHQKCHYCQTETTSPKFCRACEVAIYCSKDCQAKAWKAGHKTECSKAKHSKSKQNASSPSNGIKMHVDPNKFICWSCDVLLQKTSTSSSTAGEGDTLGMETSSPSSETAGIGLDRSNTSENIRPSNNDASPTNESAFCIHPHPLLQVTTCSPCADRAYAVEDDIIKLMSQTVAQEALSDIDKVTKDTKGDANDNGVDSYCSWCVGHAIVEKEEETDLLLCDTCPRAFCRRCTALAHGGGDGGRKIVEGLLLDDGKWSCVFCEAPHALKCMQSLLRDGRLSEEGCSVGSNSITKVGESKNLDALSFPSGNLTIEDDDDIAELIKELNTAEDAISDAAQMLEEESIEQQRREIYEEISDSQTHLSLDAVNELVEDELATWIEEWKDYHARNEDIIGTSMDLLDDRGIDPRAYYEGREMLPKKSKDSNKVQDPAWKIDADTELDKRDEDKNLRKGFFKGAMGWDGNEDYRDLEDLDEDERNEVEEINTTENTLVLLREIAKKKGKPKLVTEFIENALPKEDIILAKLDIHIVDRQSTDANDEELEMEKSGEDYSESIRKGQSCISGRIVRREVKQLARKKQQKTRTTKNAKPLSSRNSSTREGNESKPRKEKHRIVPQLLVDLTCEEEEHVLEEEEKIKYKHSDLVMATLDSCKWPKKKKQTISVVEPLAKVLKAHQKRGVQFMWNIVCGDIPLLVEQTQKKPKSEVRGCMLAHNMGLGKSLQVITLAHMLLTHPLLVSNTAKSIRRRIVNRILIVVPVNTLENWKAEFNIWVKDKNVPKLDVYSLNDCSANSIGRIKLVEKWFEGGGICLSSVDTFSRTCKPLLTSEKKGSMETLCMNAFISPGPDMVVLDEAHLMLRNNKSEISKALSSMSTGRRISLTGTPMQNNLSEYFRMASWIKPGCLGTESEYDKKYTSSIMESLNTDASEAVVKRGESLVEEIWDTLAPFVQRLDATVLANDLPLMQQVVIHVRQTKMQNKLHAAFKKYQRQNKEKLEGKNNFLFQYHKLFPVNNHPGCLLLRKPPLASLPQNGCSSDPDENATWWEDVYIKNPNMDELLSGGKMVLLLQIIAHANLIGDKCVVFSQCLKTLDYIEKVLNSPDWGREIPYIANLDPGKTWGLWQKNTDYLRIDGSTTASQRGDLINTFNDTIKKAEETSKLFLISSKAGGIGINLVGANRIILMDSNFNPTIDIQALYRCYRYGQTKPVYAYRFLTEGTMDEKVYSRSVNKTHLSARVVDQKTVERVFTSEELATIMEHNTWVQCDLCNKWRMLYLKDGEDANLPDKWFCEMNENDKPRSRCTAIERDDNWYTKHFGRRRIMDTTNNELANEDIQYESELSTPQRVDNSAKKESTKRDVILTSLVADSVTNKKDVTCPSKLISKYYFHDSLSKMSSRKVATF